MFNLELVGRSPVAHFWWLEMPSRGDDFGWSKHAHYLRTIHLAHSATHTCIALFPLLQGPSNRELHIGSLPLSLGGRRCLLPVWPALLGPGRRHRHHQRSGGHRDGHLRWAPLTLGPPSVPRDTTAETRLSNASRLNIPHFLSVYWWETRRGPWKSSRPTPSRTSCLPVLCI